MIKKTALIILLFSIARFIVSCCYCSKIEFYNYTYDSVRVYNIDNSGPAAVNASDHVLKSAYGFVLCPYTTAITQRSPSLPFSIESAYATGKCDCDTPEYIGTSKDTIASIVITTNNDFDATHPANSDVSDLFKIYDHYAYSTISEYIKAETFHQTNCLTFLLMVPPPAPGNQQFSVEVKMKDGRIFKKETPIIQLI